MKPSRNKHRSISKKVETIVDGSRGMRDTINFSIRLMAAHNDGQGMVNTIVATKNFIQGGKRYFEPPYPSPIGGGNGPHAFP